MAEDAIRGSEFWEKHCSRCSDELAGDRDSQICEPCEKEIQRKMILDGVPCKRCDGHGRVYSSIGDIQRAMNGRDRMCPNCGGSGKVSWDPDPEDVHPDLRGEAIAYGVINDA